MRIGTKSLLFGVHQIFWHPFTVWLAWIWLYHRLPNLKETICIFIHDWGYWGCRDMDGEDGSMHPCRAANMVFWYFGPKNIAYYFDLCLFHSRHLAKKRDVKPSKLCWADKASILFDPWWLYLPRAWMSGELHEYRESCKGSIPVSVSHREWYRWARKVMLQVAKERRGDAAPYMGAEAND